MFFQDDNPNSGAGEQQSVDEARGPATGDTDLGLDNLCHGVLLMKFWNTLAGYMG
ncbi:hypothetical protein MSTO_27590 [Mycobacterium stomatepiae]|uniref:Uncharacterized protein n=1 Tax=Mycobacterium stomatepiae TaxID=470076 RepID=A0A7I7Q887_9MYCO|nr:hypothetical protein MSTO_27590 [Mycobacterium stomatepiae]